MSVMQENAGTVIVLTILLILIMAAVAAMYRAKKQGKSTCGCSCGSCAMGGICHSKKH